MVSQGSLQALAMVDSTPPHRQDNAEDSLPGAETKEASIVSQGTPQPLLRGECTETAPPVTDKNGRDDTLGGEGPVPAAVATAPEASEGAVPSTPAASKDASPPSALLAELAEWEEKAGKQREKIAQAQGTRADLRTQISDLQQQIAALTKEKSRFSGGIADEVRELCKTFVGQRAKYEEEIARVESDTMGEEDLQRLRCEVKDAALKESASAAERDEVREAGRGLAARAAEARDAMEKAEERVRGMVAAGEVQKLETETHKCTHTVKELSEECRQLRVALAESLYSSSDLQHTRKEMDVLKDSAAQAAERVKSIEEVNGRLRGKLEQVHAGIKSLRKGTVDLSSEGELMREVIVQQSEDLVRRLDDLTDERKVADADRRQLLATTARLLATVDESEVRLANRATLEELISQMEVSLPTTSAEVERLRGTNDALCQQALGEEAEGKYAGALATNRMLMSDSDDSIFADVSRLVHGQQLQAIPRSNSGDAYADAAALALLLQQTLAERAEAFWLETQRLSDRIAVLERTRGGRTSQLLREYDAKVRGKPASGESTAAGAPPPGETGPAAAASAVAGTGLAVASAVASGLSEAPAAAAAAAAVMNDGFSKLRGKMWSG